MWNWTTTTKCFCDSSIFFGFCNYFPHTSCIHFLWALHFFSPIRTSSNLFSFCFCCLVCLFFPRSSFWIYWLVLLLLFFPKSLISAFIFTSFSLLFPFRVFCCFFLTSWVEYLTLYFHFFLLSDVCIRSYQFIKIEGYLYTHFEAITLYRPTNAWSLPFLLNAPHSTFPSIRHILCYVLKNELIQQMHSKQIHGRGKWPLPALLPCNTSFLAPRLLARPWAFASAETLACISQNDFLPSQESQRQAGCLIAQQKNILIN